MQMPSREPSGPRDRRLTAALVVVVVAIAALGISMVVRGGHKGSSTGATAPSLPPTGWLAPPTGGVDLAGWKLSVPERNDDGDASSIDPAAVTAPWLTEGAGGSLEFWAPTAGVTTKNSQHPRTELQSLTTFGAGTARHTLSASLTLVQLPQDGRGIILGQIHGADDISSVPFVMLRVQNNQLRVVVKQAVRFQAGDYQQADASDGAKDGGRVDFQRLSQE